MKAHQWRIAFLGALVAAFSIAIPSLAGLGHAAGGPAQGRDSPAGPMPGHPVSSLSGSADITIAAAGFDPAVLTVAVDIEVTWYNATDVTHTLQIVEPRHVYLPLVLKNSSGSGGLAVEGAAPIPQPMALPLKSSGPISATLPPGGTFAHTFTSVDIYSCFLTAAPQLRGLVIVVPGITGGEKPVQRVYQPPLDDPVGLAVNAAETVAYVVEKGTGRLVAVDIDPASPTYRAITPIATGLEDLQMGLALDPTETNAYVVENEPGTLKRVTLTTGQATTIAAGLRYPHDVGLSPDGTQAYVTLESGALVRVTIATGQVFTVTADLFHPAGVAVTPDGTQAVVSELGRQMQRVDLTTGSTIGFNVVGYAPYSIALDPAGDKAFVGFNDKTRIRVVDIDSGQIEQDVYLQYKAADIAINPSGSRAYLLWRDLGQIATMDLDTWWATPFFEVLHNPAAVALNATETQAYVLEQDSGELSRIALDPASPDYGQPVCVASVGSWQGGGGSLAVSADETWALITRDTEEKPSLLRVDLTTGQTSTVTSVEFEQLRGLALSPDERFAYVTNNIVNQIDLATGDVRQIGDYADYQTWIDGIALTADGNSLYAVQWDLNRLLEVDLTTGEVTIVSDEFRLPASVALAPDETTAWVLEEGKGGSLVQVDLASGNVLHDMPLVPWIAYYADRFVSPSPGALALKADGTTAYVPMGYPGLNHLYTVDLTNRSNVRVLYRAAMLELQDATLNEAETRAYIVDEASDSLYQVDTDPASPSFGQLSVLVDGTLPGASQVALSPDEETLVVAPHTGELVRVRTPDGEILSKHSTGTGDRVSGLALHPVEPIAYVVAEDGGLRAVDLTVYEDSTPIASGLEDPRGLALNATGTIAYLVEGEAGRLVSVDLSTGAVNTVATGLVNPLDVVLDEAGGVAYVSEYESGGTPWVRKVELATGALEWAYTGAYGEDRHEAIVLSQDRQYLYLARHRPGALWRINLAQAAAAAIPPPESHYAVTYHPEPIYEEIERQQGGCLSPNGSQLYLGDEDTPRLLSLDLTTRRVSLAAVMDFPLSDIAITPDGRTAYIGRMYDNSLIELDLETGGIQTVFNDHVWGLVLDPTDPNFAYVVHPFDGQVSRLDLSTGTRTVLPIQFEPFPAAPETLDINAAGTHLYLMARIVGELGDSALVRLDLATGEATTVALLEWNAVPGPVVVDQAEQYAYVSEVGDDSGWGWKRGGAIWRVHIDPSSPTYGQVELVVPDVGEIWVLALDPAGTRLLVSGGGSYVIFEVD
jgi:DNA-binding beta-propeller fold protein YncE